MSDLKSSSEAVSTGGDLAFAFERLISRVATEITKRENRTRIEREDMLAATQIAAKAIVFLVYTSPQTQQSHWSIKKKEDPFTEMAEKMDLSLILRSEEVLKLFSADQSMQS